MPEFNDKQVQKFNSLLLLFLQDLSNSVPDASIVMGARDFLGALISISPADTSILESFMTAFQGCADFLASHNTDIFSKASSISDLVTKDDVINIYRQLEEADRETVWKYVTKLYNIGKKACPNLVREGDFDFNNINPHSPIHGLVSAARTLTKGGDPSQSSGGGLVRQSFRQMTYNMLDVIAAGIVDPEAIKLCHDTKAIILSSEETDRDCAVLMQGFEVFYTQETAQGLVMQTEATIRNHGLPFLAGGGEFGGRILDTCTNSAAIITAVMQCGTVYVTLGSMNPETISKMEALALRFYKKVEDGEVTLDENSDPMTMMSTLAGSGLAEEIFEIVKAL